MGVSSLLPCASQGLHSGHQTWQQGYLLAKPSQLPLNEHLKIYFLDEDIQNKETGEALLVVRSVREKTKVKQAIIFRH